MSQEFAGKVALVTGGTNGIGEAVARALSANGAKVVFTGNNVAAGEKIAAETQSVFVRHDVSDVAGWQQVMDAVAQQGRLDVAFANAGINTGDSDIEDLELDAWNRIVEINCTGVMLTCKNAIAAMKGNPGGSSGSIIINSSVVGMFGLPDDVTYTATKGAVRALSKSVAVHCAKRGYNIRCNSIHPGITETPNILNAIQQAEDPALARTYLENSSPLRRLGTVDEIADLVLFLASERSSFITGADMVIDGGATAGFPGV